jgi:predicted acyltransferase
VGFLLLVAGTFGAATIATLLQRQLGAPYWAYFAIALSGAIICYLVSNLLIQAYVRRRTGEFDTAEVSPGVQAWELTAGRVVVPRWVSALGLFSLCFALAILFELTRWALDHHGLI